MIRPLTKVFLGKENENTQSENVESFESAQKMFSSVLPHQAKKMKTSLNELNLSFLKSLRYLQRMFEKSVFYRQLLNLSNAVVHIAQERIADRRPCLYYNVGGAFIPKRSISFVGAFDSYLTKNLHICKIQVLQIFYSKYLKFWTTD